MFVASDDVDGDALEKVDDPISDRDYNGLLRRIPAKTMNAQDKLSG